MIIERSFSNQNFSFVKFNNRQINDSQTYQKLKALNRLNRNTAKVLIKHHFALVQTIPVESQR